jgi:ankyrin repeat protein
MILRYWVLFLLIPVLQGANGSLHQAAKAGDIAHVRSLLEAGTDVNATDADGRTALMLDAGADATKRDAHGVSALSIAKGAEAANSEGSAEVVTLLRNAGARESPEELLDEAIRAGDLDAVAALLEAGVDLNWLDLDDYQTPLMTALELRARACRRPERTRSPSPRGKAVRGRCAFSWNPARVRRTSTVPCFSGARIRPS